MALLAFAIWELHSKKVVSIGRATPPNVDQVELVLGALASGLAIFGALVLGGIYLEIPAVIIAGVAVYRQEKGAWASMFVCLACLVGSLFLAQILSRFL